MIIKKIQSKRYIFTFILLITILLIITRSAFAGLPEENMSSGNLNVEWTWKNFTIVAVVTFTSILLTILMHYEALRFLTTYLPLLKKNHRLQIITLIFGLLIAHEIEIWIFAAGYMVISLNPSLGYLQGSFKGGCMEYVYYSSVVFTALGFGDTVPVGPIRYLTVMEALCGLLLIAWSAAFTFLKLQTFQHQNGAGS